MPGFELLTLRSSNYQAETVLLSKLATNNFPFIIFLTLKILLLNCNRFYTNYGYFAHLILELELY